MALNKGYRVSNTIKTTDTRDKYPTADENDILGGSHIYTTIAEMLSIPAQRRRVGMHCTVVYNGTIKYYKLTHAVSSDTTVITDWEELVELTATAHRNLLTTASLNAALANYAKTEDLPDMSLYSTTDTINKLFETKEDLAKEYYNKTDIDNKFTSKDDFDTFKKEIGSINPGTGESVTDLQKDIDELKTGKQDKLTDEQLANLNVDHSKYLTEHQDISGKQDKLTDEQLANLNADHSKYLTEADISGKQDKLTDEQLANLNLDHSKYLTEHQDISGKQDKLTDEQLANLNADHSKYLTEADISNKQDKLTETQLANLNIDHSKYLTEHQDISGKQDKLTDEQLANLNADHSKYLTEHQDISGKQDKLTDEQLANINADHSKYLTEADISNKQDKLTDKQLANLNADHSKYLTEHQDISGKQDKLTDEQLANINADHSKYLTEHQDISGKQDKLTDEQLANINADHSQYLTKTDISGKQDKLTEQQLANLNEDHSKYLTEHQDISGKADKATTIEGYGITDAYTKTEVDDAISKSNTNISKWVSGTIYKVDNIVIYNNKIYQCINDNQDTVFDSSNWRVISGESSGLEEWSGGTSYNSNDIVIYNDKIYKCKTANSDSTFTDDNWEVIGSSEGVKFWESNKNYAANDLVVYDYDLYLCKTSHTSTETFDETKWTSLTEVQLEGVFSINDDGDIVPTGEGYIPSVVTVWETGVVYKNNQIVANNDGVYMCKTPHTSGVFLTDLLAGNWVYIGKEQLNNLSQTELYKDSNISIPLTSGTSTTYTLNDFIGNYDYVVATVVSTKGYIASYVLNGNSDTGHKIGISIYDDNANATIIGTVGISSTDYADKKSTFTVTSKTSSQYLVLQKLVGIKLSSLSTNDIAEMAMPSGIYESLPSMSDKDWSNSFTPSNNGYIVWGGYFLSSISHGIFISSNTDGNQILFGQESSEIGWDVINFPVVKGKTYYIYKYGLSDAKNGTSHEYFYYSIGSAKELGLI